MFTQVAIQHDIFGGGLRPPAPAAPSHGPKKQTLYVINYCFVMLIIID